MSVAFAPWQDRIYRQASAALADGRLGHALLFCGPARLGKRAVADRLAQRLLCVSPQAGGEPCGQCRGCHLFAGGTHPDLHRVGLEMNKEGTRQRSDIVIDQVRTLSERLGLTPQYGGAQVAIVDPAETMNTAACNALLKTLEEPVPGRYLWLVSAHPARLPATIRSRCQRLEFRLPTRQEALDWLAAQGHPPGEADEALAAARGHPGLAHAWLQDGGMALRREVARDLDQLERGQAAVLATAQRWTGDEHADLRLRHAADLALDRAENDLTDAAQVRRLAAWFDRANRTRDLLRTTVRADLAVAELLMAWRDGQPRRAASGSRR